MGNKHSKKRRPKKPKSQPEVTEIIELNDNQSSIGDSETEDEQNKHDEKEKINYPVELSEVMNAVELIEKSIEAMTGSQLDLYYATLKDDLHNQWQRLYELKDHGIADVRTKKIEAIEHVKNTLQTLNGKVLMNGHAGHP